MSAERGMVIARRKVADAEGAWLHPEEAALLGPRATDKRLADFRAGRAAAREAVSGLLGISPKAVAVLREEGGSAGRPYAMDRERRAAFSSTFISISHADGVAIAVAARECVGIDLVTIEPHPRAFREEVFAPFEVECWAAAIEPSVGLDAVVCTAFAAKEAALKWLGVGLRIPLHAMTVVPEGPLSLPEDLGRAAFTARLRTPNSSRTLEGLLSAKSDRIWVLLRGFP